MISVLTVNFLSSDQVAGLAESLRQDCSPQRIELIVTNNSAGDRISLSSDSALSVTILESANNGFAAGINQAFRASHGEFLMVANPDVRVTAGSIEEAVGYLTDHPQVGLALPLLRYPTGEVQLSVRRFYTWPVALYARSPLRLLGRHPAFFRRYLCDDLDRTTPSAVDWGLGAAMFLRRADCSRTGVFDERFFMYFEDVDLCYRMWQTGKSVMYCPQIECIHEHRRSSKNPFSLHGWRHLLSFACFVAKHRGLHQRPIAHTQPQA
jgi:N-acetylglucosaminyl-diphospho-decaprenol L-rhamnosyltransferase